MKMVKIIVIIIVMQAVFFYDGFSESKYLDRIDGENGEDELVEEFFIEEKDPNDKGIISHIKEQVEENVQAIEEAHVELTNE